MANPTDYLHKNVLNALWAIAPERKDEFHAEFDRLGVQFRFDTTEQRIRFAAELEDKVIIIGTACLDRLWATCFAYFRFYQEIANQRVAKTSNREVDLRRTPELREAGELLKWAIEADLLGKKGEQPPPWPSHLTRPRPDVPYASDEHVATELFLVAVAFLLHHEFAHLRKDHNPYNKLEEVDRILQEKEADREAAGWILGKLPDEHDAVFVKRALGVGLGLLWIASLYVYAGVKIESTTHPPAYDRLYQVVELYVQAPNNLPWAFVQAVLALHLQNQNVKHETDCEFGSFKEAADYFVDVISKMYR